MSPIDMFIWGKPSAITSKIGQKRPVISCGIESPQPLVFCHTFFIICWLPTFFCGQFFKEDSLEHSPGWLQLSKKQTWAHTFACQRDSRSHQSRKGYHYCDFTSLWWTWQNNCTCEKDVESDKYDYTRSKGALWDQTSCLGLLFVPSAPV